MRLQPYVRNVRVRLTPSRGPPLGTGRYAYRYLTPEMMEVDVQLGDRGVVVDARLRHRPDLRYSLMEVVRAGPVRRPRRVRRRTA